LNNFVTIKTFMFPSEAIVLKGRLESEGIECFVKDELISQVNPFYSNAMGGVKLQVRESDVPVAIEIMKEGGYLNEEEPKPSPLFTGFDNATAKLGLIGRLPAPVRMLVLFGIVVALVVGLIWFASRPTAMQQLTKNGWCLDRVTYRGKNYTPHTLQYINIVAPGFCSENISFRENGSVMLPGFNSYPAWGQWKLVGQTTQIMHADTFDYIYNGSYNMNLSDNVLILKSPTTILYCHNNLVQ